MEQKHVTCTICDLSCTLKATVDKGKIIAIQGLKEQPMTPNVFCIKAAKALETYYHENRLLYPLKRKGERGSGQWEQISWQQAMDEIGEKLKTIVDMYGPEAFACSTSEYNIHNGSGTVRRFMNLLGSPNYMSGVSLCLGNTAAINRFTYGWFPYPDFEQTRCIVYFGHNPKKDVWAGEYDRLNLALKRGAKLIVLDPQKSEAASRAHIHLPLRAGTDAAMGLGWLNVIIHEELYDKSFVKKWTVGFDKLKERVNDYPLSKVAEITGVKAELIREAAIMYATSKPGIIPWSCITDQQVNSTSVLRIQAILRAITGNLNVAGGEMLMGFHPQIISESDFELHDRLPDEKKKLQLGADTYSALTYKGADMLRGPTKKVYGHAYANLLKGYSMAHPPSVFKAMRESKPYPVKAFVSSANNTLMCYSNLHGIHEALKQLDLFVVHELFMTPTAQLADYVLPGDCFMERSSLYNGLDWLGLYLTSQKLIDPPDRKSVV
jgi:anaerobic selenocysteine-containing dehydrogenase